MFEVGWSEILVIAIVMIVIVGPKDLPKMLRTFGKFAAKARGMAGDFQRQFNDALKEAELDDVKDAIDQVRDLNPKTAIKKHLNPFENAAKEVRSSLDSLNSKPAPVTPEAPAASEASLPAEAPVAAVAPQKPAVAEKPEDFRPRSAAQRTATKPAAKPAAKSVKPAAAPKARAATKAPAPAKTKGK